MKKVFIAAVVVIMLIPAVWMLAVGTQPMFIEENRTRAERPWLRQAYTALLDTGEYARSFSDWFDDNYGFRDVMIRTRNQINYSLFGSANGVYIGEEGYLAYHSTIESQKANEKLTDDYFESLYYEISKTKELLAGKGIDFYIMLPPHKNTVFPERFESIPAIRPEQTKYDYLTSELSKRFPESFIDVTEALREAEKTAPVFFKTDFHWNNHGATAAFSLLTNRIAGQTIYSQESYTVESYEDFRGTQLNNFSVLQDITETGYSAMGGAQSVLSEHPLVPDALCLSNPGGAKLGKLLIIGDSYSNYVITYNSGVSDCFSEVVYVNMNNENFDGLLTAITKEQADYVLFESIENAMPSYAADLQRLTS